MKANLEQNDNAVIMASASEVEEQQSNPCLAYLNAN